MVQGFSIYRESQVTKPQEIRDFRCNVASENQGCFMIRIAAYSVKDVCGTNVEQLLRSWSTIVAVFLSLCNIPTEPRSDVKLSHLAPGNDLNGDLLDSTLWNSKLAPPERIVYALVQQIFHGIREYFLASAELKMQRLKEKFRQIHEQLNSHEALSKP